MDENRTFRDEREHPLSSDLRQRLEAIGFAFDLGEPMSIHRSGEASLAPLGNMTEKLNERRYERRPPRPRQRRHQNVAAAADAAHDVIGRGVEEGKDLFRSLEVAYPGVNVEDRSDGWWLVIPVLPLGVEGPQVTFIVAFPSDNTKRPRAWAFEKYCDSWRWMGPRHTNVPDGSICAFPEADKTWRSGGIRLLIDMYLAWSLKHFHWRHFKRWPGHQTCLGAWYRQREFELTETCSCESGLSYKDCHFQSDRDMPIDKQISELQSKLQDGKFVRSPPHFIYDFVSKNDFLLLPHVNFL